MLERMAASVCFSTRKIIRPTLYLALRYLPLLSDVSDEKAKPKSRTRDRNAKLQKHAAQIYAEMLAQVCHKDLYERNIKGSQEVLALL